MAKALRTSLRYGGLRQGGLQPGLGGDDIFATASLDLNFAVNKNLGTLVDATTGTTLVDHTRASSGTYVGSDGLIKTATTNYALYSEDLTQPSWSISGSVSRTIDTTQGEPFPGAQVTKVVFSAVNEGINQSHTYDGNVRTISLWIKGVAGETIRVFVKGGVSPLDHELSGDWERIDTTGTPSTGVGSFGLSTFGGVTARTIYVSGVQFEEASTAGEYIKTTSTINSAPRFDHNPTTGESLGLLVEESRTNLITRSEDIAGYFTEQNSTPTPNATTAPDGTTTADLIVPDTTLAKHTSYNTSLTFAASTAYSYSIFVKPNGYTWLQLLFTSGFDNLTAWVNFNLTGAGSFGFTGGGELSKKIEAYPNGWYRCTITATSGSSPFGGGPAYLALDSDGNAREPIYAGDGTSGIYLWGAQLEEGSFPTSYIPTTGTTVTRAADVADISGNNFGTTNLLPYSEEFDQAAWSVTGSTITPNVEPAPNSTLTADKHTHTGGGPRITRFSAATVAANADFTFSFYAKAGTSSYAACSIYDGTTTGKRFWFNLTTGLPGSITNIGAGYPSASSNMQSVGNGWYRCIATITNGSNTTVNVDGISVCLNQDGVLTPSVSGLYGYIWGAQLEQSDVVTPYVKSNVTWNSRASNATYYDSTGTIRKSSYNELLWSEEFDTTWTVDAATIDPNQIESPSGAITSDRFKEDLTSTTLRRVTQSGSFVSGQVYTASVFAKYNGRHLQIRFGSTEFTSIRANFDLQSGVKGSVDDGVIADIVDFGNGWYRCIATATAIATKAGLGVQFGPILNSTAAYSQSYTGDGVSGFYLWGAQLEKGTYAGDYAKTEATAASTARNAAYLPDDNGNFVSAGPLLLEEQRTNLITDSSLTTIGTLLGSTISSTAETNPEGIDFCQRLLSDAGTSILGHRVRVIASSANNITVSAFVKKDTHRYVYIGFGGTSNSFTALFDIDPTVTGDRLLGQGGNGTHTNIDAGYQNFPNGWVRIWAVGTTSGTDGTTIGFSPDDSTFTITDWSASGTEAIFIHGVQHEDNVTFPSSYIPTYGIAATRSADVSTSTSGFGNSWYSVSEGTVFAESLIPFVSTGTIVSFDDDTANNRWQMRFMDSPTRSRYRFVSSSGSFDYALTSPAFKIGSASKAAFYAKSSDQGFSIDSNYVQVPAPQATMPNVSRFEIGKGPGAEQAPQLLIKRLTYWPARLPNETLQTITQ